MEPFKPSLVGRQSPVFTVIHPKYCRDAVYSRREAEKGICLARAPSKTSIAFQSLSPSPLPRGYYLDGESRDGSFLRSSGLSTICFNTVGSHCHDYRRPPTSMQVKSSLSSNFSRPADRLFVTRDFLRTETACLPRASDPIFQQVCS